MDIHTKEARAPLISLILPVYNGAHYIRSALDSIFAQSFTDFELIAVDDCSTDETPHILAEYAARHDIMRVITNDVNSKLPASLNNGFRIAKGQWLSWTSDDNILRPDMMEKMMISIHEEPDNDIYYADYRIIDEEGKLLHPVSVRQADNLIYGNVIGCCFLYSREVDQALNGYNENLFGVEDYDFWLRAMQHGFRFHPIHQELYLYRRHGQSLTDTISRHIHERTIGIMLPVINALPKSPRRASAYINLACRDAGTLRWKFLWLAFRDSPLSLLTHCGKIARWLKFSISTRLRAAKIPLSQ